MLMENFKISDTAAKFENDLLTVISVGYGKSIKDQVKSSIFDLVKLRSKLENINNDFTNYNNKKLSEEERSLKISILLKKREELIIYINYINRLVMKFQLVMSYDKRNLFLNFDNYFVYYDQLTKGGKYNDGLVNEYLFSLYNLCIVYYKLGIELKIKNFTKESMDKFHDSIKESMKNFQYAAAGLSLLKEQVNYMNSKLTTFPNEMNINVLNFNIAFCNAEVQSMVYHLAEAKHMDTELQANLAKSAGDLFENLKEYLNLDPFKNQHNDEIIKTLVYYSGIYNACAYEKMSYFVYNKFKESGINFEDSLSYIIEALNINSKSLNVSVSKIKTNLI